MFHSTIVHHQPQGAELVFLALAIALPQFATLAVEHDAGELMTTFAAVELHQNAPPVSFVVNEAEQVERFYQPAEFFESARQLGRTVLGL